MSLGISREELARVLAFELRRPEMSGEPFSVTTMAENVIAALSVEPSPDVWEATVGDRVRCVADNCPGDWREDWRDWTGYIAGIHYEPRVGLNFTVSDRWPPESNGDLSDGFREGQLVPDPPKVTVEEDRA